MKKLLFKNILLNKKNIILGILATIFFSLISIDDQKYYIVALLMCPSLLFSFVVGKMCYLEDSIATQQFLLSLPISKKDIIFEKNIMSYICIVIGLVIASLMGFLMDLIKGREFYWNINLIIIFIIFSILYNTIYIFLNYKYDYSKTQFTTYILMGFMLILFKFGGDFIKVIDESQFWILACVCIATISMNCFILRKIA